MTIATSRAAVLVAPQTFEFHEYEIRRPGEDGAIIEILASGICGTDVEQYYGWIEEDDRRTPIPAIPGHEPIGRIVDIGERTARLWDARVGDVVTARSAWGCGVCTACLADQPVHCLSRGGTYGFVNVDKAPSLWGGFAEHQFLHHLSVVKRVPDGITSGIASLINPVACGLSWGARVPDVQPGETVVVLGSGQRGLSSVAAAKIAGAGRVVLTGIPKDQFKLDAGLRLGADEVVVLDPASGGSEDILDATRGGADIIVDTTPFFTGALAIAARVAKRRARIVSAGIKGSGRTVEGLPQDDITLKELSIIGVSAPRSTDFLDAVDLLAQHVDLFGQLHTHSFGLIEVEKAIRVASGDEPGYAAIHVALEPALSIK